MKKPIPYGVADYEELVRDNGYFVDKTLYIEKLERIKNPVFLRPRRFGKSLLCRILECYYDIGKKDRFDELFGRTRIGEHPTPLRNSFFVLHLDLSTVDPSGSIEKIEKDFNDACNLCMETIVHLYRSWFKDETTIIPGETSSSNLKRIFMAIRKHRLPRLYVIIDEYDNFANQLIVAAENGLYDDLMAKNSFLRTFFKTLKEGRKTGAVANVFITGVLPITMDDLASGFNIATFITLDPEFENMLGFTQAEADVLLDEVYRDYSIDPSTRNEVHAIIKNQYNGYRFVDADGEGLYNST
ncbi:MAG: AAA family ATPase, partial [Desulfobacterales bacterium]|nr:AAA family ATPase [Desulfobacterales bacterium]